MVCKTNYRFRFLALFCVLCIVWSRNPCRIANGVDVWVNVSWISPATMCTTVNLAHRYLTICRREQGATSQGQDGTLTEWHTGMTAPATRGIQGISICNQQCNTVGTHIRGHIWLFLSFIFTVFRFFSFLELNMSRVTLLLTVRNCHTYSTQRYGMVRD